MIFELFFLKHRWKMNWPRSRDPGSLTALSFSPVCLLEPVATWTCRAPYFRTHGPSTLWACNWVLPLVVARSGWEQLDKKSLFVYWEKKYWVETVTKPLQFLSIQTALSCLPFNFGNESRQNTKISQSNWALNSHYTFKAISLLMLAVMFYFM